MSILKTPKSRCSLDIGAMNGLSTKAHYITKLTIKSIHSEFSKTLSFFVVPKIIDYTPNETFPREQLKLSSKLKLADPNFHKPSKINMLIGAGPTLSLFCIGQFKLSNYDDLIAQKTKLGWVIAGSSNVNTKQNSKCLMNHVEFDLEKFWKLEEMPISQVKLSPDEQLCEDHFKKHIKRNNNGRYVVALPFKKDRNLLGNSRQIAEKRLLYLQKRFKNNPEFKRLYEDVIQEYKQLGHMSLSNSNDNEGYYLPHHAVMKESSNTTKLRVVFDASAKSSTGVSLNDILYVGPKIQDDLFPILLRFRTHTYVIIADIEKMYRQFLIREEDRKYLKILWLENGIIIAYESNTITFGVKPAPYLAIRCLQQLAEDEKSNFPIASKIIEEDLYVDNMLTGADSKSEAQEICSQITNMLNSAKMNMRQWASNHPDVLQGIEKKNFDADFNFDPNCSLKTLGIFWRAKDDIFHYKVGEINYREKITKRKILSETAKIYDPIGLLGPIIFFAKKIIQDIWCEKTDWDESVSSKTHSQWIQLCSELKIINKLRFDRHVLIKNAKSIELHGFCDASQSGYGACIYLKSTNADSKVKVSLLCSKSRVAPIKTRTIPRLELCAMQLLTKLYVQVSAALSVKINHTYFWSDSTIALNWINTSPNLLKVFVGNRVSEIQTKTNISYWHHIRSEDNPADALSRGQLPHELLENYLWKNGPKWLQKNESDWPKLQIPGIDREKLPEKRKLTCLVMKSKDKWIYELIEKSESFEKLLHEVANSFYTTQDNNVQNNKILQVDDIDKAEKIIIKAAQKACFSYEYSRLKRKKSLAEKNSLASLDPFIDEEGFIRVGGRLRKAIHTYAARHPIILPRSHTVTRLIIRYFHELNHHSGIQNTIYAVREKYWPINCKNQTKQIIHDCIPCFRAKPRLCTYKMGDLPSVRVRQSRPFNNVGVDYCGPFYIKEKKWRNQKFIKCYVAIFICMAVKAVHIEIVEDLTTESFLAALSRFISRRGVSENIYSDNGTQFKGANNKLEELYKLFQTSEFKKDLVSYTNKFKIKWHFIPPEAPNFGGLWESNVKQFKHHFKRVAADKRFTIMEFATLSTEIEAILNSRPLTQISDDVNDYRALTPGHFLIGDALRGLPEPSYNSIPENRLNAWENIKKIKQDFWKRWHKEYLNELNVRHNKGSNDPKLKIGQLVLVKEDNVPCLEWITARISELHPGEDKIVRTVTISTPTGTLKRPATKIAVLPVKDNENT